MLNAKSSASLRPATLRRELDVWSAGSLVTGTIIGAGIFLVPSVMALCLPSARAILEVWILGGILSYLGALAYAELGTMFPMTGGQYIFLRESFGAFPAFLCGWAWFLVVIPGTIAALATGFSSYLGPSLSSDGRRIIAVGIIAILTWIQYRGLRLGSFVQNTFTVLKLIGILFLAAVAILIRHTNHLDFKSFSGGGWRPISTVLMVTVMAYDGWNNLSFINGEIRNPQKSIPRALGIGVLTSVVVYILMMLGYMRILSLKAIGVSSNVGHLLATSLLGSAGGTLFTVLILISILGALNGTMLTAPRLYFAQANDGLFFARFSRIHPRYGTPSFALLVQGLWSSVLSLIGSYELMAHFCMFCAWLFYLLVVMGLMFLRWHKPELARPYRMWGFPVTPLVFVLATAWFLATNIVLNPWPSIASCLLLAGGIPAYLFWKRQKSLKASS
jgi:APA family basic amino acid/polyamine antiporter